MKKRYATFKISICMKYIIQNKVSSRKILLTLINFWLSMKFHHCWNRRSIDISIKQTDSKLAFIGKGNSQINCKQDDDQHRLAAFA